MKLYKKRDEVFNGAMTYGPEAFLAEVGIDNASCQMSAEADWPTRTAASANLAVYLVVRQLRRTPTLNDLPALRAAVERDFAGDMQMVLCMPEVHEKFARLKENLLSRIELTLLAHQSEAAA